MNDKVHMLGFRGVPLNKTDIDQAKLNIEDNRRSNLFQWNGQFSPQFIEVMLQKYAPRAAWCSTLLPEVEPFCMKPADLGCRPWGST